MRYPKEPLKNETKTINYKEINLFPETLKIAIMQGDEPDSTEAYSMYGEGEEGEGDAAEYNFQSFPNIF